MRKEEKIAVLQRLLAKVRANAGDRLPHAPLSRPMPRPPTVDAESPKPRNTGAPILPLEAFDSWGSLADAPQVPNDAAAAFPNTLAPPAFAPDVFIPPPSASPRFPRALAGDSLDLETIGAAPDDLDTGDLRTEAPPRAEPAPRVESSSEIHRVLELATREPRIDPTEPGAIFSGAAYALRERKSTMPPPGVESPPSNDAAPSRIARSEAPIAPPPQEPQSAAPQPPTRSEEASWGTSEMPTAQGEDEALVAAPASIPAPLPQAPTSRRLRYRPVRAARLPRSRERPLLRYAIQIAIGAGLIGAAWASWIWLGRPRSSPPPTELAAASSATPTDDNHPTSKPSLLASTAGATGPDTRNHGDPASTQSRHGDPMPGQVEAATSADIKPSAVASAAARPPIPDASRLPEDKGYLLVDAPPGRQVYIHGVLVGDSNAWLVVPCGFRYLRLADSTSNARSFPAWASEGVSIVMPCRGATTAKLP